MTTPLDPIEFTRGPAWRNRFMLAPLTNLQSHPDGVMSEDEFRWLTKRAAGGFGLVMTCAAHVQRAGQGFPGQLGIWDDKHIPGLTRMAAEIKKHGSVSSVQLHHAGMRSPEALIGERPLAPSDNAETNARGLSTGETEQLIEDFILGAMRAEKAGFDGVEIHGAHSYILCQYLAASLNQRTDRFGGSAENRARIILDIIDGVRARCRHDFQLGLRLSPERFDLQMTDIQALAEKVMTEGKLDYLDMSLWDAFKEPIDENFKGKTLLDCFTGLKRGNTKLGAAGKIYTGADVRRAYGAGLDFVVIGRGAILHHDFPKRFAASENFEPIPLPVTPAYLREEGLGEAFVQYMGTWKGFVEEKQTASA